MFYVLKQIQDLDLLKKEKQVLLGGELGIWDLRENYELIERPKTIDEAIDELFKPLTNYINNKNIVNNGKVK